MGFFKYLAGLFDDGDGFTVCGQTAIKGLKRGDYAKVTQTIAGCPFKRGDEVMISAIDAKNNRYVDCVNYKREYGRIHEIHLLKIGDDKPPEPVVQEKKDPSECRGIFKGVADWLDKQTEQAKGRLATHNQPSCVALWTQQPSEDAAKVLAEAIGKDEKFASDLIDAMKKVPVVIVNGIPNIRARMVMDKLYKLHAAGICPIVLPKGFKVAKVAWREPLKLYGELVSGQDTDHSSQA